MDKWAELRTAYLVAQLGTVSAAASSLGVHRATVSRQIDLLEEHLGAPVFIRHTKGYTLTDLGEEVLRVAGSADALFNDLSRQARLTNDVVDGELRIAVLPPFTRYLTKPIQEFRERHPSCRVIVDPSYSASRLEYGDAHIALRTGEKPDHPDYVVRSLGMVGTNLYAHDDYVRRKGKPRTLADMADHEFAIPTERNCRKLHHWPWIKTHVRPDQIAVASESFEFVVESILSGHGLGFLLDVTADDRKDLHPLLPKNENWDIPVWLVTHVDLNRVTKVQAMLDCLKSTTLDLSIDMSTEDSGI